MGGIPATARHVAADLAGAKRFGGEMTTPALDLSRVPDHLRDRLETQLSRLPADVRATLLSQLARLSPEQLANLLERGSPLLDKLLARAEQAGATAASARKNPDANIKPAGHYNRTVQPGDQPGLVGSILFAIAAVLALVYLL